MKKKFIDLVIGGPDMSGTSTQISDIISYLDSLELEVRDIRGTEVDALFHTSHFKPFNRNYLSYSKFFKSKYTTPDMRENFLAVAAALLIDGGINKDLKVASMAINNVSTHIKPNSADAWIMEEPTKRGAGQVCRTIEQHRSKYGSCMNPVAAAEAHSVYRTDEFLRFRKILREEKKIIVRSRSEESACYQIFDKQHLPKGVPRDYYLNLAGHRIAFANPPSHIFVACGPESWTEKDYLSLKKERSGKDRLEDDHEKNAPYQVLVNRRYATDWLENLYEEGCLKWGGKVPEIIRFDLYETKENIKQKMAQKLDSIIND